MMTYDEMIKLLKEHGITIDWSTFDAGGFSIFESEEDEKPVAVAPFNEEARKVYDFLTSIAEPAYEGWSAHSICYQNVATELWITLSGQDQYGEYELTDYGKKLLEGNTK